MRERDKGSAYKALVLCRQLTKQCLICGTLTDCTLSIIDVAVNKARLSPRQRRLWEGRLHR